MKAKDKNKSFQKRLEQDASTADKPLLTSAQYTTFQVFIVLIFGLNLLVLNDVLGLNLWGEKTTLEQVGWTFESDLRDLISGEEPIWRLNLPIIFYQLITKFIGENIFAIRLVGVIFFIFSLLGTYNLGRRFLGEERIKMTILILMSSFLMVNFAKFAMLDIWIGGIQMLLFCALILYLKKSNSDWWNVLLVFAGISTLIAPMLNGVFILGLLAYLYFFHPNGKVLKEKRNLVFVLPLIIGFFVHPMESYFWFQPLQYLKMNILGMLLFLPFLLPALWQLIQRLRKREEFSILIFGGLLMGFLTLSLSIQFFFAILVAKQMKDYFDKNYPYQNAVKTLAIFGMIGSFSVSLYYMLNGFRAQGAIGFRAPMLLSLAYWIPNFVFLIGLYAKRRRMIEGSLLICGVLLTLIFWMHTAPLLFKEWF